MFNVSSKLSLIRLDPEFTNQTTTDIQLASLSVMLEFKRSLIWQRILKAAMVQKYRTSIQANFAVYDDRDFVKMLPEDQSGVISYIATPTVNVYKTRLDMADMQFVAADAVENLILFANVLSVGASEEISLPASKHVRLFGQVLDMRTDSQARAIQVADGVFRTLEIGCDEFLGALSICNTSGTAYCVIVDGLRFGLQGTGPSAVPVIESDVRKVTFTDDDLSQLENSLQFSMTFAESVVSDQSASPHDDIQLFVRQYLRWLPQVIPADTGGRIF